MRTIQLIFLLGVFSVSTLPLVAQATNTFPARGSVGIGTLNPDKPLSVRADGDSGEYPTHVNTVKERFVALYLVRGSNQLEARASIDGITWTVLGRIRNENNLVMTAASGPGLFWDGYLYHAAWFDSNGRLRYAASRDAAGWMVDSFSLGTFNGGQPAVARGNGKVLIAFNGAGNNIYVMDTANQNAVVVAQSQRDPGLTFGNGQFVLTYAHVSDGRIHMKRSSNGSNFAEVSNTVGGYGWPPSVTFSDGKFFVLARGGSNPRGFIHSSPSGLAWANNGPIIATHVGIVTRTAIARTNSKLLVIESRGGQLDAHVAAPGDSSSSRTLLNWSAAAPGIALAVGRTVVRQQVPKPRLRHTEWQGEIGKTGAGNVLLGSFANQPAIQGHGTGTSYKLLINPYGGNVGIGTDSPQGTLDVHGTILQRSVERHPDYVFETNYPLESIEEHAEYMWSNKHLRAVGTPAKDGDRGHVVELGAQQRGILEELEKAHIYIEQLHKRLSSMEDRLSELMAGKGR